ncbi:MAG: hypothetical protein QXS76_01660 [Candidatus Bathyarchaeia archaeon]
MLIDEFAIDIDHLLGGLHLKLLLVLVQLAILVPALDFREPGILHGYSHGFLSAKRTKENLGDFPLYYLYYPPPPTTQGRSLLPFQERYYKLPRGFSVIQNRIHNEGRPMEKDEGLEEARKWLKWALNDPIAKILLENSNLTKKQYENLLIGSLRERFIEKGMRFESKLRLKGERVSRGAFYRTLRQARGNVLSSIYTIFLLGYVGLFDSPRLEPFIEVSNALKELSERIRGEGDLESMENIRGELERILKELVRKGERERAEGLIN